MPDFRPYVKRYLPAALAKISDSIYTVVGQVDIQAWCSKEPLSFTNRLEGRHEQFSVGDKWGDLFDCAWFNFTGKIPPQAAGHRVVLLLDVNGEMCVVNEYGVPTLGLTSMSSTFDFSLGRPGKRVVQLTSLASGGESIDVWVDAGCNDLFGNLQANGTIKEASIAVMDDQMDALYYDFEVLDDLLKILPEQTARHQQILVALTDVLHMLQNPSGLDAVAARAELSPLLQKQGGDPSLQISAIGHAHMDLAWLWPIRETIRKGARTFATVIDLLARYPDYVFGASQPQYFRWIKERYPMLYAKIKRRVREGRIEPQGAMWVEADTNITGGESLIRQILYGKAFFKSEFGIDINYLWLPDVFGYSAALPQILKKSGVDYFLTQKLSWNVINQFPHHSFHWQGLDGTQILAHMLPEETYNGPALPRSVTKIEQNYQEKGVSEHALMAFGIGDGGGGPGKEHLERLQRIANLAGLCPVTQRWVSDFLPLWAASADQFPTWNGELYLERHQGTLTTQARSKWYNRKIELSLREAEWTSVLTEVLAGAKYPKSFLDETWQKVLLYQFHDILPGSSIKRVYDESLLAYQSIYQRLGEKIAQNSLLLSERVDTAGMIKPVVVHNSLSWARSEWLQVDGEWLSVSVPPMGYKAVDAAQVAFKKEPMLAATETLLENDLLIVQFSVDGAIRQIYDKRLGRKVLVEEQGGNNLRVYADHGDAWDFPMDYAETEPSTMALVSSQPELDGPCAMMTQTYQIGHSQLVQKIILTAGSSRVDFETCVHWLERQTMLRTSFAVDVHADDATFNIQFGHIRRPTHRNTTWDLARDEVVAHKWVDLSQRDYGVALLNDSKYGHKVKDNIIDLNLLRSVPHPGPRLVQDKDVLPGEPHHVYTDQCDHVFTYSLYSHLGDQIDGRVNQVAYELNVPLRGVPVIPQQGTLPAKLSFLRTSLENVVIESVKRAEDREGIVIRLYECDHRSARTTIQFDLDVDRVFETDLLEGSARLLPLRDGSVTLRFEPFEIKTLRVLFK